MNRSGWPWWRWVLTGLNVFALALSGYLAWHSLAGGSVIGCSGGSACDQVLNSRWSSIGGLVPVSGLAMGAYLALLVAGFCVGPATAAPVRWLAWRAMLVLAGAVAGSAVWFIVVQAAILGAFCPYCMTGHVTGLALAALILWQAPRQWAHERDQGAAAAVRRPGLEMGADAEDGDATSPSRTATARSPLHPLGCVLLGVCAAGLVAASQAVFAPATIYSKGDSRETARDLDPRDIPLLGSPEAPYVVTLLFDYNCSHCQRLHFLLEDVVRRSGGQVAFALCPAPLNTQCNPYIPQTVPAFANSCELARVALAVWVANRGAFPAFDQWMFSLESGDRWHPRTVEAAKARARELVGAAKFDAAWSDPWIDRYLQTSVQIFGHAGAGAVPKFVFGPHWVTPESESADELAEVLQDALLLPKPRS